jgi:hypothetical protein
LPIKGEVAPPSGGPTGSAPDWAITGLLAHRTALQLALLAWNDQRQKPTAYILVGTDAAERDEATRRIQRGYDQISRAYGFDKLDTGEMVPENIAELDPAAVRCLEWGAQKLLDKKQLEIMSQLSPVNLQLVLDDLQCVVNSVATLGGESINFADPFSACPPEERKLLRTWAKEDARFEADLPPEKRGLFADSFDDFTPDGYMRTVCDDAWDTMNASLQRLRVMLDSGKIDLLDCNSLVRGHLRTIWQELQQFDDAVKPEFTPGRPNPLWGFIATVGVGKRLASNVARLQRIATHKPATDPPGVKTPSDDTTAEMLFTEAQNIFGFTGRKQFDCFLNSHTVRQRKPTGRTTGRPVPNRRLVNILDVAEAIAKDVAISNDPIRMERIQQSLQKAEMDKKLEDSVLAMFRLK